MRTVRVWLVLGVAACAAAGGCASKPVFIPPSERISAQEARAIVDQGDRLLRAGDHMAAVEKYKDAIRNRSDCGDAWNNLGLALMKDNNRYDAQQALVRAAELMPRDPRPFENLGVLYMDCDLPADALTYFERSLECRADYLPSIRGAVLAAQITLRSDEATLDRIKLGLRMETDPKWRDLFLSQMARVGQELEEGERNGPKDDAAGARERADAPHDHMPDAPELHADPGIVLERP